MANVRGVALGINHQMRLMEPYRFVKNLIQGARLGDFVSMTVCAPNFGWANNGSHYLEAFLWLTGSPIKDCQGWFEDSLIGSKRGSQFFDYAGQALVRTVNNERLYIDFGSELGQGLICVYGFQFGRVTIDQARRTVEVSQRVEGGNDVPTLHYGFDFSHQSFLQRNQSLESLTAMSIEAVTSGEDFVDGDRGVEVISCLVAGVESSNADSIRIQPQNLHSLDVASTVFLWG